MGNNGHPGLGSGTDDNGFARPEPFRVDVQPDTDRASVMPQGELDLDTVHLVAAEVDKLAARGFDRVVIDLRATSFLDSSGVHLLLKCARRGDLRISVVDGPPAVGRVFDLAGVRDLLVFEEPL
jgi:anti-anti-sigma factor